MEAKGHFSSYKDLLQRTNVKNTFSKWVNIIQIFSDLSCLISTELTMNGIKRQARLCLRSSTLSLGIQSFCYFNP